MTGRVLHAGPAIVDVSVRVSSVPAAGSDVYGRDGRITAGGGFNVMAAAARDGARVVYLGLRGDGAFSRIVDEALLAEGVTLAGEPVEGLEVGWCVAMVDESAERTFVSVLGCEGLDNTAVLERVEVRPDDVVYVTGYSFLHEGSREALARWLPTLPDGARLVVEACPLVADLPEQALALLRDRAWLWTLDQAEAVALLRRLDPDLDLTRGHRDAPVTQLASWARGAVVLRTGADGCWLATPGPQPPVHVAATRVDAVDTTGAGDTHTGVLMAHLAAGGDLLDGVRRANVAAAVSVTRRGPATSPTRAETDSLLSMP